MASAKNSLHRKCDGPNEVGIPCIYCTSYVSYAYMQRTAFSQSKSEQFRNKYAIYIQTI